MFKKFYFCHGGRALVGRRSRGSTDSPLFEPKYWKKLLIWTPSFNMPMRALHGGIIVCTSRKKNKKNFNFYVIAYYLSASNNIRELCLIKYLVKYFKNFHIFGKYTFFFVFHIIKHTGKTVRIDDYIIQYFGSSFFGGLPQLGTCIKSYDDDNNNKAKMRSVISFRSL